MPPPGPGAATGGHVDGRPFLLVCALALLASAPARGEGVPPPPPPALVLRVAPDGSDAGDGSRRRPLATLTAARDAVRALKRSSGLPPGGVAILVSGGRHAADRTLELTEEDSGAPGAPVVWRAARGESPVISGGARLLAFEPVTDPDLLARWPEASRRHVVQVDLRAAGLTNLPPLRLGGFSSGRGFKTHPVLELFFDGRPLPRARWPHDGFARVAAVSTNAVVEEWGRLGSREGRVRIDGDRPARWRSEPDLWLYGYWFWGWADSYERVTAIDAATGWVQLEEPLHFYGYARGQPFFAFNAASEIDQPGEWSLDQARGRILFYPPSRPERARVECSVLAQPLLTMRNVSNVWMEGLTWELGAGDGIRIAGGSDVTLAGCTVRRCGGDGMVIDGGLRHRVQSCDVYDLGRGGLVVSGGDLATLTPGLHVVANCHIHHLSRVDHTYTPAVLLYGVGNRVTRNLMHDVASSALRVNGNDHLIDGNEVCRVVLESDDQGGADMHGDPTFLGNVYRGNFFHHIGSGGGAGSEPALGQGGIRLDDAISGVLIRDNIFYRTSRAGQGFGAVQIHGGKDNVVAHNLFVDCGSAVSFTPWEAARWRNFVESRLARHDVDEARYRQRYPQMAGLAGEPNGVEVVSNVAVRCGEFLLRGHPVVSAAGNLSLTNDPGFADAARGDFRLTRKADPAVAERLGGRSLDAFGLYADAWRPRPPRRVIESLRAGGDGLR